MHNRKNIILMFLIVMLSFAMISEVSAVALEDAEPGESGPKGPYGSFNSTGSLIPGERLHEVSDEPVDDTLNNPHSNNTYQNNVPFGTTVTMNFYEQHHEKPLEQKSHDGEKAKMCMKKAFENNEGEKMNLNLRFDQIDAPEFADNGFSEVIGDVMSDLIGMENLSTAFKSNRDDQFRFLPQCVPESSVYVDAIPINYYGDFNQYNGDLSSDNITPETDFSFLPDMENISPLNIKLPEIDEVISTYFQFPLKDFLPESYKTQDFENTHLPKLDIHNDMPLWNNTQKEESDLNESDEGNSTPNIKKELKI